MRNARAALNNGRKANTATGSPYYKSFGNSGSSSLDTRRNAFYELFDGLLGQQLLNEASLLIEGGPPPDGESYAAARYNLAFLFENGAYVLPKNEKEAVKWYRKASDGGSLIAMNDLAWLLATSPDAKVRNGPEAVTLAEKSVALTGGTNAAYLDALAAAYAETGQFDKAVGIQKQATKYPASAENKKGYLDRLKLYEDHSPFRQPN